jgi:cytoskeleton protein RodZ
MANFGASFKQSRESKGISLDQIAAETRISTRFLQAIEDEEFNLLPGGIFNRGFVRTYAEKLGLDADQAVTIYERLTAAREPAEVPATPPVGREGKARRLYPVAIGGLILLIAVFYVVTRESSNLAQTASAPPAPPASATSVPAPPSGESAAAATATVSPTPPPETTTSPAAEPAPAPAKTEAVRLDMDVKEETWIKVDADGNAVDPGEILESGMTRHFGAQKSIVLTIGNAAGVALKINDMPSKNLGANGKVRELIITPDNFKDFVK